MIYAWHHSSAVGLSNAARQHNLSARLFCASDPVVDLPLYDVDQVGNAAIGPGKT
jgi:hypothetical protein